MRKPIRLYRGLRRKLLKKLQNAINSVKAMDDREALRAERDEVDGDFFSVSDESAAADAFGVLLDRASLLLAAKTS